MKDGLRNLVPRSLPSTLVAGEVNERQATKPRPRSLPSTLVAGEVNERQATKPRPRSLPSTMVAGEVRAPLMRSVFGRRVFVPCRLGVDLLRYRIGLF
jgi:hypothetical protein